MPDEDGNKFVARGDDAIRFWTEGIATLPDEWDIFVPDDLVDVQVRDEALRRTPGSAAASTGSRLRLNFESEGVAVTQDELARCLAEGRKYVRLADGTFARIDPQKVREVLQRQAEILATGGGNGGQLPLSQAGRIEELLAQVGRSSVTGDTKELFKKLQDIDEIKGTRKPRNLKAQLRPYQEQGFHWLWFLHEIGSGGVLADDMGLGKTVQTLALLLAVKNEDAKIEGKRKPFKALIVAPTSVVTNWLREMDRFAPSLRHALWHGAERKERQDELEDADVVVTSYALLRRDEELLKEIDWRYVILDEAQQIKNPLSATARAAKRLQADRRLALSGTPIENRLSEIWSIFDFVSPGAARAARQVRGALLAPHRRGRQGARPSACAPRSTPSSCAAPRPRSRTTCPRRSRPTSSASSPASRRRSTRPCSRRCARRSWARSSARAWRAARSRSSPA